MPQRTLHILMDNRTDGETLTFEHGWSAWLDLGSDGAWLWDTGQTGEFLKNATKMGINPLDATGVALSHGHYDHAGGLSMLLAGGFDGPVVAHPDFMAVRYSRRGQSTFRSIGIGDGRLLNTPCHFLPTGDLRELAPGVVFVSGITRRPGAFTATYDLFLDTAGLVPDAVPDDACLVIDNPQGPLVLLGCCHSGLGNTLFHVSNRLGFSSFHTVVGGLHLSGAPVAAVEEAAAALKHFGVQRLFPGHCTGEIAVKALRACFSGEIIATGSGLRIDP